MNTIKIENRKLVLGKKELSLLSGEVHYWRLDPDSWGDVLDTVKEMGLEIVSTYIPWQFHEQEKKLDFTGSSSPRRDLVRFIKILEEKGLYLIVRPGPFIFSEWANKGVPDDLLPFHKNHEMFKKRSKEYIHRISQVLEPYFYTRGGPVIMIQADNEIDIWSKLYEKDLGLLNSQGIFQDFLKEKYKTIKGLNRAWKTELKDFSKANPVTSDIIDDISYKQRFLDFMHFRHFYTSRYANWVVSEYKTHVDIPVYLNAYPWLDTQNWNDFQDIADLFGIDIYPAKEFSGSVFQHRSMMDKVRFLKTFAKIPFIAEFESGLWHGIHYKFGLLPPHHYRLICFSALAAGAAGWNWYMIVGRDNWYMAPINEWGKKKNELWPVFKNIIEVFKAMDPAGCTKLTDVSVSFDYLQGTDAFHRPDNPLLHSLYESDTDYEFFDLEKKKIRKSILFYSNQQFLSRRSQRHLLEYIEQGGCAVFFQEFPHKDETFQDYNLLGIEKPHRILEPHEMEIQIGNQKCHSNTGPHFAYDRVPGEPVKARLVTPGDMYFEEDALLESEATGREYTIGYIQERSKGKIMVIGVVPTGTVVKSLLKYLKAKSYSYSETPGIVSTLFRSKGRYFLILLNNSEEPKQAVIILDQKIRFKKAFDLVKQAAVDFQKNRLNVLVDRKDGTVIQLGL
ncbi:MAG: beta-galactosidase [Spirochaetes bacterium]|nr:beta-galactosidase [Spirochaetota bacterium]